MSASDALGKQFHGTNAELKPGDAILPRAVTGLPANAVTYRDTRDHVTTTAHLPEASRFGNRVYVVRPVGVIGEDPEYQHAAHRIHPQAAYGTYDSRHAIVEREVSPAAVERAKSFARRVHPEDVGWMGRTERDAMVAKARRRRTTRTD